MRGRNNNNRKGPNPLTRNYESNGPDVKIRGSAQQIAEKYATLARDAMSSGDRVMAENYLQHAEHYNRIIAAAQAQFAQHQQQFARDDDDDVDDDGDDIGLPEFAQPSQPALSQQQPISVGSGPQPVIEGMPAEVALTQGEQNGNRRPNGGYQNGDGGEDGQPRRGRRNRRGRSRSDFAADGDEAAGGSDGGEEAAEAAQQQAEATQPVAITQD